jgi:hypothetical protein
MDAAELNAGLACGGATSMSTTSSGFSASHAIAALHVIVYTAAETLHLEVH